tara:strand:- start:2327 stop:2710 length:384 start_codon:yes stop_codon:yes gene_type:complete
MSNTVEIMTHEASLNYTGSEAKGDGYYGSGDGVHTVAFYLQNYLGRIHLEGSLATTPTASDWFAIKIGASTDYVEYTSQTTETFASTVIGNFVWLRARVDRSAVAGSPTVYVIADHGQVEKVLLNIG